MNVYIGFALLIEAALEGAANGAKLEDFSCIDDVQLSCLPQSLEKAIELALAIEFVDRVLPAGLKEQYEKRAHALLGEYQLDAWAFNRKQIIRF